MKNSSLIIPATQIERRIFYLRGVKVMLSVDLAELYGVAVKALNQAVR
jgi:ORF6N domain